MDMLDQYRVELDAYTGPMDLLLYLVRKEEVDIANIPIARIATEYLRCIEFMQALNVQFAGEFLVMAATLLEIKSRMLLPNPPPSEDEGWEDPCEELIRQLMEYRQFKEAAQALSQKAEDRAMRAARPGEKLDTEQPEQPEAGELREVGLWDLLEAFGKLMEATGAMKPLNIALDDTPQDVIMQRILERFAAAGPGPDDAITLALADLIDGQMTRGALISLFLAILELVRQGALRALQREPFGAILVVRLNATKDQPQALPMPHRDESPSAASSADAEAQQAGGDSSGDGFSPRAQAPLPTTVEDSARPVEGARGGPESVARGDPEALEGPPTETPK
jgi:segregation and condensation protein A